jgi:hypothetical protein
MYDFGFLQEVMSLCNGLFLRLLRIKRSANLATAYPSVRQKDEAASKQCRRLQGNSRANYFSCF